MLLHGKFFLVFQLQQHGQISDLPTHLLFSSDTRILQGSPAHLCRIASHPDLARLYECCTKCRSFLLIQSATGSWRWGNIIQWNFGGRKLGQLKKNTIFTEKTHAECSLLPRQGSHAPKFCGKNFTKSHKTTNLWKLAAFPGWSSPYTCYSHTFQSGKPLISLVLFPDS